MSVGSLLERDFCARDRVSVIGDEASHYRPVALAASTENGLDT
jgi:hypothetical protein